VRVRFNPLAALALLASVSQVAIVDAAAQGLQSEPVQASATPQSFRPVASGSLWENFSVFAGLDGSKQPQDLGINANMGARFSANLGLAISDRLNLGAQVGAGVNLSDAAVHVLDQIEGTSNRTQTFLTVGLFQAVGRKTTWGFAYDALMQQYYDDFTLGQVRGFAGYDVTETNEVGVWFTKSVNSDQGLMGNTPVSLEPISQTNGYLAHVWPTGARTRLWLGMARGHHNIVWVLPDNSRDSNVMVYGADLELPLSERFAVSGSANFLTPTATGTVDAFLGITYFPGRNAEHHKRGNFVPRQSVANNPEFPINMHR
jgi:hypothetical protein